jgi:FkbM family methyltransferase
MLARSQIQTAIATVRSRELGARAKVQFLWRGRGRLGSDEDQYPIDLGSEKRVYLSASDDKTDRSVFREIFLRRCYATRYADAVVIDIGAHKGYFGAFAQRHGAAAVHSFEPSSENFRFLELTAGSFRRSGHAWEISRAAVSSHEGDAILALDTDSWAHRLLEPGADAARQGIERVSCLEMAKLLQLARAGHPQRRLVVKVDAEGAECSIVLETSTEHWREVDEAFVEVHDFAGCSANAVAAHLRDAGLSLASDVLNVMHFRRH